MAEAVGHDGLDRLIKKAEALCNLDTLPDCFNCGQPFQGRPNKLYCSRKCKRAAERSREKLTKLVARQSELEAEEQKAVADSDYHRVRYLRARRERDIAEVRSLADKTALQNDPDLIRRLAIMLMTET